MQTLEDAIDQKIGEVRTESIDVSFGEIINLHTNSEFVIQPEYQRLFRWSPEQQSRLIESVLLELPIPQIFVVENDDGVFELIDGLQRISSVIHFVDPSTLNLGPLVLDGCDLIEELNGKSYEDLSLRLRLRIKRSTVRMTVIKRQSTSMLRYEMFKRLNTGGSLLSAQEIRNCTVRMIGGWGIEFYAYLQECAANQDFKACTETLSPSERDQKGDEELVLRFFALKNARNLFRGNVRDWLDQYVEKVALNKPEFDTETESRIFSGVFAWINQALGAGAFVRYNKNDQPVGALAPAYFEAIAMGVVESAIWQTKDASEKIKESIVDTVQSDEFREVTGPAANTRPKLNGRIELIKRALINSLNG